MEKYNFIECPTKDCRDHLERVSKVDPKTPIYLIAAFATIVILSLITNFFLC